MANFSSHMQGQSRGKLYDDIDKILNSSGSKALDIKTYEKVESDPLQKDISVKTGAVTEVTKLLKMLESDTAIDNLTDDDLDHLSHKPDDEEEDVTVISTEPETDLGNDENDESDESDDELEDGNNDELASITLDIPDEINPRDVSISVGDINFAPTGIDMDDDSPSDIDDVSSITMDIPDGLNPEDVKISVGDKTFSMDDNQDLEDDDAEDDDMDEDLGGEDEDVDLGDEEDAELDSDIDYDDELDLEADLDEEDEPSEEEDEEEEHSEPDGDEGPDPKKPSDDDGDENKDDDMTESLKMINHKLYLNNKKYEGEEIPDINFTPKIIDTDSSEKLIPEIEKALDGEGNMIVVDNASGSATDDGTMGTTNATEVISSTGEKIPDNVDEKKILSDAKADIPEEILDNSVEESTLNSKLNSIIENFINPSESVIDKLSKMLENDSASSGDAYPEITDASVDASSSSVTSSGDPNKPINTNKELPEVPAGDINNKSVGTVDINASNRFDTEQMKEITTSLNNAMAKTNHMKSTGSYAENFKMIVDDSGKIVKPLTEVTTATISLPFANNAEWNANKASGFLTETAFKNPTSVNYKLLQATHLYYINEGKAPEDYKFPIGTIIEGKAYVLPKAIEEAAELFSSPIFTMKFSEGSLNKIRNVIDFYLGKMGKTSAWKEGSCLNLNENENIMKIQRTVYNPYKLIEKQLRESNVANAAQLLRE